ncbi:MAG: glycosyltransferase family 4 protein [Calditrichia bacterium]
METKSLKIMHVDTASSWRGGQQQVFFLSQGLQRRQYSSVVVAPPDSELINRCNLSGINCRALKMRGEGDVFAAWKMAGWTRREKIDIVHAHSAHALGLALQVKLVNPSLKIIAHRRVSFSIKRHVGNVLKYNNPLVNKIICISNYIREVLLKEGLPAAKLAVIHSGIPLSWKEEQVDCGKIRQQYGISENNLITGAIGALEHNKDFPTLIRAAQLVLKEEPAVSFMVLGNGRDESDLRKMADDLGIASDFIFTGFQDSVSEFLSCFDIFAFTSRMEGLGSSILNAQSAGIPVVASAVGGIPEAVQDGKNGFLVPRSDAEAFSRALLELVRSEKLRREMGGKGRETVKQFDIEHTIGKTVELYNSLVL